MNVAELRQALADALDSTVASVALHRNDTISGLPAAIISIDTATPKSFGDGSYDVDATITVLVSNADQASAWEELDGLVSDNTIADALRTADCVNQIGGYSNIGDLIEYDDGVALGFTIAVSVYG